eukprot:3107841-Rhodomonas_salina.2
MEMSNSDGRTMMPGRMRMATGRNLLQSKPTASGRRGTDHLWKSELRWRTALCAYPLRCQHRVPALGHAAPQIVRPRHTPLLLSVRTPRYIPASSVPYPCFTSICRETYERLSSETDFSLRPNG